MTLGTTLYLTEDRQGSGEQEGVIPHSREDSEVPGRPESRGPPREPEDPEDRRDLCVAGEVQNSEELSLNRVCRSLEGFEGFRGGVRGEYEEQDFRGRG